MANDSTFRRKRQAAGTADVPGEPSDYPEDDRRTDTRTGHQDGRKRVPPYTRVAGLVDDLGWFTTPYVEELAEIGQDRVNSEIVAHGRVAAVKARQLAGLGEELAAAERAVSAATTAIDEAARELTPAELLPRNPTEAARDPDFLRSRRTAMRERRIQAAGEARVRRVAEVEALRVRIAELDRELQEDAVRLRDRTEQHREHVGLRIATYWGAVVKTHAEGRQLALLLPHLRSDQSWRSADGPSREEDGDGQPRSDESGD